MRINVRLPIDLMTRLSRYAAREEKPINDVIHEALSSYLLARERH